MMMSSLPNTTQFLPILDDLLSPDFRPVNHPVTPLETPTTLKRIVDTEKTRQSESAVTIQKWWRRSRLVSHQSHDLTAERTKHSIRHSRTEEHVRNLESEVHRLKASLTSERKLRSLQYEAIRSLWSQMQKLSTESAPPVMSQSLPNGLVSVPACVCSHEIEELKRKIESEMSELRTLVCSLAEHKKRPDTLQLKSHDIVNYADHIATQVIHDSNQ